MKLTLPKFITYALTVILGLSLFCAIPSFAATSCDNATGDLRKALGCDSTTTTLPSAISTILDGVIGIMAVICVIFVIVGGVQYLSSAGDASKVEKGKKTIIYALVGLIICALAFTIVQWVIKSVLNQ